MKHIYWIIGFLIIALVAYCAGIHTGKLQAAQECIDQVAENCDYICGVGADFYYPDKQTPDARQDEYELVDDSMVARKGDYGLYTKTR